jgi:uncharacterized protein (DUF2062 family)
MAVCFKLAIIMTGSIITMTITQRIKQFFINLVLKERSSTQLALSFCMGIYIAFSPFIGLHTIMTFVIVWALGLNLAVTFAGSCLLHNPWTTIPIYGIDYLFGEWLLRKICGLDTLSLNPSWMALVNEPIQKYLGLSNVSFWSFMVGGNILGIVSGLALYPIMKRIFAKLVDQVHATAHVEG